MTGDSTPQMRPDLLQTGMFFAGRFKVQKSLGSGAMGKVYLAIDMMLGEQLIALKILSSDLKDDPIHSARFLREVQLTRQITHPNVVRTFDIGEHGGSHFFTMEYIDGKTLSQWLNEQPCSLAEALRILKQICAGLTAIHDGGIIHRDLKTSNVMIAPNYVVKIADFGVARPGQSNLTGAEELVGSATHMAPEVWKQSDITSRADLYSLGVIAYELLTGILPFDGKTAYELMWKHLKQPPVPPSEINPTIPPWISRIVLRLLEKDPRTRPATAEEIIELLENAPQAPVGRQVPQPPQNEANDSSEIRQEKPKAEVAKYSFSIEPASLDPAIPASPPRRTAYPRTRTQEIKRRAYVSTSKLVVKRTLIALTLITLGYLAGKYAFPTNLPFAFGGILGEQIIKMLLASFVLATIFLSPSLIVLTLAGQNKGAIKKLIKLVIASFSIGFILFGYRIVELSATQETQEHSNMPKLSETALVAASTNFGETLLLLPKYTYFQVLKDGDGGILKLNPHVRFIDYLGGTFSSIMLMLLAIIIFTDNIIFKVTSRDRAHAFVLIFASSMVSFVLSIAFSTFKIGMLKIPLGLNSIEYPIQSIIITAVQWVFFAKAINSTMRQATAQKVTLPD